MNDALKTVTISENALKYFIAKAFVAGMRFARKEALVVEGECPTEYFVRRDAAIDQQQKAALADYT